MKYIVYGFEVKLKIMNYASIESIICHSKLKGATIT